MAWSDGFESYAAGSNIAGQGGWEGWTGNVAAGGTISTAQAASGTQSLQIVRGNDTVQRFSGINSGVWELTLQQYVPSSANGVTWVILMNSYPSSLDWSANVAASRLNNRVVSGETGAFLPLVVDQWAEYKFTINLTAGSLTTFYNGQFLDTHPWRDATGLDQLQALDLYADENTADGTAQVGSVYYDNVSLVVPEPTSFALLALGGLALALRRKLE